VELGAVERLSERREHVDEVIELHERHPIAFGQVIDERVEATSGSGWTFGEQLGSTLWTGSTNSGSMRVPAVFVASRVSQAPEGGRRGGGSMIFIQLVPHTNVAGKIADLTLSYRLPNQTERISQSITLDYMRDPQEILEEPYLSYPEMSERYAMYNMFLGLRFATRSYSPSCAAAALRATRANAVAWQMSHEDPDIAADITLIDQYLENLGATGEQALDQCGADDPYNNDGYYGGGYGDDMAGCSAGGNSRGLLPIAVAAVLGLRRRRRTR
jgi:MYXO-CTERM domain-containing protein